MVLDTNRPYFLITSVDSGTAVSGQQVQKIGRSTGWTYGAIGNTCVDHRHELWPNSEITECTYEADFTNAQGDSGGPVFNFEGTGYNEGADRVRLVGIVLGEVDDQAVFSKWSGVIADLSSLDVIRALEVSFRTR